MIIQINYLKSLKDGLWICINMQSRKCLCVLLLPHILRAKQILVLVNSSHLSQTDMREISVGKHSFTFIWDKANLSKYNSHIFIHHKYDLSQLDTSSLIYRFGGGKVPGSASLFNSHKSICDLTNLYSMHTNLRISLCLALQSICSVAPFTPSYCLLLPH